MFYAKSSLAPINVNSRVSDKCGTQVANGEEVICSLY